MTSHSPIDSLDPYEITSDPAKLDIDVIHAFLTQSYWSPGIPIETVRRAVLNSLCFGALFGGRQIGFARVVSDRATFAYLADVFVLDGHRGRGVAQRIMRAVMAHPDLQGLRRWMLLTRDAHPLYAKFGFTAISNPERFMQLWRASIYQDGSGATPSR